MNAPRLRLRALRPADVPAVDALLRAAYGQPGSYVPRLHAHLALAGTRSVLATLGGRPAGVVFGNDYGTSAYVSLMGVDPALQRRGIAGALMRALCAWADERGFADLQLDATPAGAPVYERFGFRDDGETVVVTGRGGGPGDARARFAAAVDRPTMLALDRALWGADRGALLAQLIDDPATAALVTGDPPRAFALVHGNLGPWIAGNDVDAGILLDAARALRPDAALRVCVPSTAARAFALLHARGFARQRSLRHMVRGAARTVSPAILARINLGQG